MLELNHISASYGDGVILQDVSLTVGRGEVVCLLGRNGAGKTTTVLTIMGYLTPRTGEILWRGQNIGGQRPYRIARSGFGFVPQERCIFPSLTVRENLSICIRNKAGKWSLEQIYAMFPRLAERESNYGSHLSGGEQQMLAIARALVSDPEILLLDEPSEGLAPLIVESIIEVIRQLREQGMSILLVEQAVGVALDVGDRFYVLDKGEVRFSGTAADVVDNEAALRTYLSV